MEVHILSRDFSQSSINFFYCLIFIISNVIYIPLDSPRSSPMSDTHSCGQLGLFDTVSGTAINLGNRGSGSRVSGLAKEACVEPQPGLIKVSFALKNFH